MNIFQYADHAKERTERDNGISIVQSNSQEWSDLAFIEMQELARKKQSETFTAYNIRNWITRSCGKPHHLNCWGAFTMRCIRSGLIEETNLPMERTGSHCRKQTVYKWGEK